MLSNLFSLLMGRPSAVRVYVNGVEIDKIKPRLSFLDDDDWMTPLLKYVFEERRDWGNEFYIQTGEDPRKNPKARMTEIWFGPVPPEVRRKGYWQTLVYHGPKVKGTHDG